jgi:hypothetical protein
MREHRSGPTMRITMERDQEVAGSHQHTDRSFQRRPCTSSSCNLVCVQEYMQVVTPLKLFWYIDIVDILCEYLLLLC